MIAVGIRDVSKLFGDVKALDGVNIEIEPGELFFLLGPSGCGKTTLLRTIAGFYIPEQGQVFFGDEDVTRRPPHKRHTGMVFQSYALWPHKTVSQNVSFGLEEAGVPKTEREQRTMDALKSVRMEGFASRKPNTLSGGQQQRIALARALVVRPQCLLLDEPLSNLDAKLRLEMRSEIRRICKDHQLTTIYVTHDQKEALSIADRIAVLKDGCIHQVGTPLEIYKRPLNAFVADFIGETNFIPGTILREGGGFLMVQTPFGDFKGVPSNGNLRYSENDPVKVCIRPESFKLEKMEVSENCFTGKITSSVYYGEMAQYQFQSGTQSIKVFEINPRLMGGAGGDDLYAWVDPEDVVILKE